ncbi:MAG: thioredoxin, partial [Achromobacter spanius]
MFATFKKIALGALLATSLAASVMPLTAQAGASTPTPAPEFSGIEHWLNSDPLTLASLRGKVVLVDFWTYTCINCVRTLPYVTSWYQKYKA